MDDSGIRIDDEADELLELHPTDHDLDLGALDVPMALGEDFAGVPADSELGPPIPLPVSDFRALSAAEPAPPPSPSSPSPSSPPTLPLLVGAVVVGEDDERAPGEVAAFADDQARSQLTSYAESTIAAAGTRLKRNPTKKRKRPGLWKNKGIKDRHLPLVHRAKIKPDRQCSYCLSNHHAKLARPNAKVPQTANCPVFDADAGMEGPACKNKYCPITFRGREFRHSEGYQGSFFLHSHERGQSA